MDDAALMRALERFSNLLRNHQSLIYGNCALRDAIGQRRALHQLHHERILFDAVNNRDIRVIQRSEYLRLAPESSHSIGIVGEDLRKNLDRDFAVESGVGGTVDLSHTAFAD